MLRKVTALKIQKNNPNRVNVYLDGDFGIGLVKILAAGLRIGQELSAEKIADLQAEDAYEEALLKAYHYLSYRPRSEAEIQTYLEKRSIPEAAIAKVLERLRNLNIANDVDFAQLWVNNRSEFRPRGKRALRMELRQKGLPEEIIDHSLDSLEEEPLALDIALKKAGRYQHLPKQAFTQKMFGLLARRGFDYDTITQTIRQVWGEIEQSTSDEEKEEPHE